VSTDLETRIRKALDDDAGRAPLANHQQEDATPAFETDEPQTRTRALALAGAIAAVAIGVASIIVLSTRSDDLVVADNPAPTPTVTTTQLQTGTTLDAATRPNILVRLQDPIPTLPAENLGFGVIRPGSADAYIVHGHGPIVVFEANDFDAGTGSRIDLFCSFQAGAGGACVPLDPGGRRGPTVWQSPVYPDDPSSRILIVWAGLPPDVDRVRYTDGGEPIWREPIDGTVIIEPSGRFGAQRLLEAVAEDGAVLISTPVTNDASAEPESRQLWHDLPGTENADIEILSETGSAVLRDCLASEGASFVEPNVPVFSERARGDEAWLLCTTAAQARTELDLRDQGLPPDVPRPTMPATEPLPDLPFPTRVPNDLSSRQIGPLSPAQPDERRWLTVGTESADVIDIAAFIQITDDDRPLSAAGGERPDGEVSEIAGEPAVVFIDETNNTIDIFFDRVEQRIHVVGRSSDLDTLTEISSRVDLVASQLFVDLDGLGLEVISAGIGSSTPAMTATSVWGSDDPAGTRELALFVRRPADPDPRSTMWFGSFENKQVAGTGMWHSVGTNSDTGTTFQSLVFVRDDWLVELTANGLTEAEFLDTAESLAPVAPAQFGSG